MSQALGPKRLPKNYRLVFDVVCALETGQHASASEIFAASRARQSTIGYSTVYRALERLRDLGLVLEVRLPGSPAALYEAARSDHSHFRCGACGRIDDIAYALPPSEVASLSRNYGVAISGVVLTFNGTCRDCHEQATRD